MQERFGILCWLRYRDDIFAVFNEFHNVKPFLTELNSRTGICYKSGLEAISRLAVPMLDVLVRKNVQSFPTCLRFEPFFKPSNRSVCLSRHSMHARGVHSWPIAEIHRLASISRTEPSFIRARNYLLARFRRNLVDQSLIDRCIAINPFRAGVFFRIRKREVDTRPRNKTRFLTIVLPYHPALMKCGLYSFVRACFEARKPDLCNAFNADVSLRIAWCNSQAPLYLLLRSCN